MVAKQEFAARRQKLMTAVGKGNVAILSAAPELIRNGDSRYQYRPNSDFYYLTGFAEPEALAVFLPGRAEGEFVLFNQPRDPAIEQWVGPRAGQEGARKDFSADQSFPIAELGEQLPTLLTGCHSVYYSIGHDKELDQQIMSAAEAMRAKVRAGVNAPDVFIDISKMIHTMRWRKSVAEIELMRKAAQISAAAHIAAMQACKPGVKEYELEAEILYHFTKSGSRSPAYNCIVGTGANACVLHYIDNNAAVKDGDLVLIDAGAEYNFYAADITRTFPANGKFTVEQKAIYELVLKAQLAVIAQVKPGVKWNELQITAVRIITEGLVELGILKGKVDDLITAGAYKTFYMHNIGHWLGMDVHDAGSYKINGEWIKLEPGVVLTVEPGIYISPNTPGIDKKWWGIGVRIEDDVLVTADGYDVLSKDVPKSVAEIEKLMQVA